MPRHDHQHKTGSGFAVNTIASRLEGLEETIITKLIDRAQFCVNRIIYEPGSSGFRNNRKRSLFAIRLYYQEHMDALFGRFTVPEERPFHARLPRPKRAGITHNTGLFIDDFNCINLMPELVRRYCALVPKICRRGDDGHYGSSSEHDAYAIQAIGRRVHYGALYVAESKFRRSPDTFLKLIRSNDEEGIIRKLTRPKVEERILRRIRQKVESAQKKANPHVRHLIDPLPVVDFYRRTVIPLTKKGEALYLLHRKIPIQSPLGA
ncbi:MAG: hypothetical protein JXA71_19785 [Chitinispirillaceae bacterium]|nr:hypothetical protein [Chitinispirillaceae bacterium]